MKIPSGKCMLTLLVCSFLLILLTSCWSRVETNDRAFVIAMFVDAAPDNQIELTLGFVEPNRISSQSGDSGGTQNGPYNAVSIIGKTIADAYQTMQASFSRDIFWGQAKVVVVGHALAKRGIEPITEFAVRTPSFPLKTYFVVASGKAKEIAQFPSRVERFPPEIIREMANRNKILNTSIKELLMAADYGEAFIAGMIDLNLSKETGSSIQNIGAALFKNKALAGTLTKQEMRGALWIRNRLQDAVITISSPTDSEPVSIIIRRSRTKIHLDVQGEEIVYKVKVTPQGRIMSSHSDIDLTNPDCMNQLEATLAKDIQERIESAFMKTKQLGADVFRLSSYVEAYKPALWKTIKPDWGQVYKNKVMLDLQIDAAITMPGAIQNNE